MSGDRHSMGIGMKAGSTTGLRCFALWDTFFFFSKEHTGVMTLSEHYSFMVGTQGNSKLNPVVL